MRKNVHDATRNNMPDLDTAVWVSEALGIEFRLMFFILPPCRFVNNLSTSMRHNDRMIAPSGLALQ